MVEVAGAAQPDEPVRSLGQNTGARGGGARGLARRSAASTFGLSGICRMDVYNAFGADVPNYLLRAVNAGNARVTY